MVANAKMDVRKMREQTGLNQSDFWSRVGVTQSGGSRYESGRSLPKPVTTLLELAYGTNKQAELVISKLRERK